MHVCLICEEYPPAPHGGNGSLYSDLAEGLVGAGHRVTVVGIYPNEILAKLKEPDRAKPNLRIVRLPQSPNFLRYRPRALWERRRLLQWLKREHRENPIDVIEAADYAGWLNGGGPKGVPTVIRMGGSNLFFDSELKRPGDPFEHKLERNTVARATHLAAVSNFCAQRTLQLCGLSDRPCTAIHNAVDTTLFAPDTSVPTEPGLIVFVNSINPKKGIEQLVDAMNIVCKSHANARLVVIGQDTQKKVNGKTYVEQLQARVQPEYRDRVIFTGRLDRHTGVLPYLRKAAVCCYPSHMETFGIAPVEAMALGKPTIYSKSGPGPEVIEHGVSGLLCDPFDPKDIAAKISSILHDPVAATRLGENARKLAVEKFDKANWIRKNVEFFESCCG